MHLADVMAVHPLQLVGIEKDPATFKKAQSLKTFAQQSPLLRNLRRAGDICAAVETFKNSSQSWGIGISNFKNNHNLK